MKYWRLLANERVTVDKLIEGWSDRTGPAAAGRHVLAIQDSSDIKFETTEDNRRGLGKVKKGKAYGVVLHAMLAVDADDGGVLGLVSGQVRSRAGTVATPHGQRALANKESMRWVRTATVAKEVLAEAARITVINDREGDFYAHWSVTPAGNVHLLSRMMNDHALAGGGTVRQALDSMPVAAQAVVSLRERGNRAARAAQLSMRFGTVAIKRPGNSPERGLPDTLTLNVIEVRETRPPRDGEPVHWILLTTHEVATADQAWRIVAWYKQRWLIEQLFRTLKLQGLRIEDSQLQSADRLCKIVAIAAKAAAIVIQLVQARDGKDARAASVAFNDEQIKLIALLQQRNPATTAKQKNPHPERSLAWAAFVIAKLGGWNVYEAKPPGPITFFNGLDAFQTYFDAWKILKNV